MDASNFFEHDHQVVSLVISVSRDLACKGFPSSTYSETMLPTMKKVKIYQPLVDTEPFEDNDLGGLGPKPLGNFNSSGDKQMVFFFEKAIRSFSQEIRDALEGYLELSESKRFFTPCAGSECPMLVKQAFVIAVFNVFGIRLEWICYLSAEKNERKRNLAKKMLVRTPDEHAIQIALVEDATKPVLVDASTGDKHDNVGCHSVIGGFPCPPVSVLNKNRAEASHCIQDASKSTGQVYEKMIEYEQVFNHVVEWGIFENVRGLALGGGNMVTNAIDQLAETAFGEPPLDMNTEFSNLDYCAALCEDVSESLFLCMLIDPKKHLKRPSSRERLYMPHIKRKLLGSLADEEVKAFAHMILGKILGCASNEGLEHYLFSESNDIIRSYYAKLKLTHGEGGGYSPPSKKQRLATKWPDVHAEEARSSGIDLPTRAPSSETVHCFPGLLALSKQQLSLILVKGISIPEKKPGRTIDVNPALDRTSIDEHGTSIITPKALIFLTHRARLLIPIEMLQLMSIHYGINHDKLAEESAPLLASLAGNAFEASAQAV
jgi:hypothetical protein